MRMKIKWRKAGAVLAMLFLMAAAAAGCAKQQEDEDTVRESVQEETLDTSGDTVYLSELTGLLGKKESAISEVDGISRKDGAYQAQIFGEALKLDFTVKGGKVKKISFDIADAGKDAVESAVAEQAGSDGEEQGKKVVWDKKDYRIYLKEKDKKTTVKLEQE